MREYIPIENLKGHINKNRFQEALSQDIEKATGYVKKFGSGVVGTAKTINETRKKVGIGMHNLGKGDVGMGTKHVGVSAKKMVNFFPTRFKFSRIKIKR